MSDIVVRQRRRPLGPNRYQLSHCATIATGKGPLPTPQSIKFASHSQWVKTPRLVSIVSDDTPLQLKLLEKGWREARKSRLGSTSEAGAGRGIDAQRGSDGLERRTGEQEGDQSSQNTGLNRSPSPSYNPKIHSYRPNQPPTVRFTASTRLAFPTPPLTPPPSPPEQARAVHRSAWVKPSAHARIHRPQVAVHHVSVRAGDCPVQSPYPAIIAHPLPPTGRPTLIRKDLKDRIMVYERLADASLELSLHLAGGCRIDVSRGGTEVIIGSARGAVKESLGTKGDHGRVAGRRLKLDHAATWTQGEQREWLHVARVVETFKRDTPSVMLFLPLGRLTITCSAPPDVILSFRIDHCDSKSGDASPTTRSSAQREARRAQDKSNGRSAKIRARYSRSTSQLQLDVCIADTPPPHGSAGRLWSRRIVPLVLQPSAPSTKPVHDRVQRIAEQEADLHAARALGIRDETQLHQWRGEELEAVQRLWTLRSQWLRWV
ncbi:hypothetical protein IAU60_005896 [Kwoniella sp. DSM 27419]